MVCQKVGIFDTTALVVGGVLRSPALLHEHHQLLGLEATHPDVADQHLFVDAGQESAVDSLPAKGVDERVEVKSTETGGHILDGQVDDGGRWMPGRGVSNVRAGFRYYVVVVSVLVRRGRWQFSTAALTTNLVARTNGRYWVLSVRDII